MLLFISIFFCSIRLNTLHAYLGHVIATIYTKLYRKLNMYSLLIGFKNTVYYIRQKKLLTSFNNTKKQNQTLAQKI